jgi:hypothetical protein
VTLHIPERGAQLLNYNGAYSSTHRLQRAGHAREGWFEWIPPTHLTVRSIAVQVEKFVS